MWDSTLVMEVRDEENISPVNIIECFICRRCKHIQRCGCDSEL